MPAPLLAKLLPLAVAFTSVLAFSSAGRADTIQFSTSGTAAVVLASASGTQSTLTFGPFSNTVSLTPGVPLPGVEVSTALFSPGCTACQNSSSFPAVTLLDPISITDTTIASMVSGALSQDFFLSTSGSGVDIYNAVPAAALVLQLSNGTTLSITPQGTNAGSFQAGSGPWGGYQYQADFLLSPTAAVPEPAMLPLLAAGLLAAGLFRLFRTARPERRP